MLKNDYENLTFLNSSSISIRDLLLRTRIGSHTLYISFESYKGHRSASAEERYHFKEGKSEIGMRALGVIALTQTSSSPPSTISSKHTDFGTAKELTNMLYNLISRKGIGDRCG